MNKVRSVWETVGVCMHALRELMCTANISNGHGLILLKFQILLSDKQMTTVISVRETVGAWAE